MKLIRRIVTPVRAQAGLLALLAGSLFTSIIANVASVVRPMQAPPALATPTPRILAHLDQLPRSLGAAASPRRYEYENIMTIQQGGKTIVLPAFKGVVDAVLGPVVLTVAPGATVTWDPTSGLSVDTEVAAVFASSDTPAEDATHGVVLWGTGADAPAPADIRTLDPMTFVPETLSLPIKVRNDTSQSARVTIRLWLNAAEQGGGVF